MIAVDVFNVVLSIFLSVLFTSFFIPQILIVSFRKRLFDYADERKVHTGVVPRLGGVAFVPSIIVTVAFVIGLNALFLPESRHCFFNGKQLAFGVCAMLLLYFEGIMAEGVGLRYRTKFVFQIFSAILIVASGVWLNDFYGLFGVYAVSPYFGMPFTVLIIVFLINAINLIDGIDGLASGLSIVASFFFGLMFVYVQLWGCAILAFATFGTLCPFFYYNVFGKADKCRKIFMGDTGSQCIGLILSFLAVRLAMREPLMVHNVEGALIIAFSMLIVPAFDVIRVVIHRMRQGRNPFEADRCHIHHKLLDWGLSHKTAMVSILIVGAFFVVLNWVLLPHCNTNLILAIDILLWTVSQMLLTRAIAKRNRQISQSERQKK